MKTAKDYNKIVCRSNDYTAVAFYSEWKNFLIFHLILTSKFNKFQEVNKTIDLTL